MRFVNKLVFCKQLKVGKFSLFGAELRESMLTELLFQKTSAHTIICCVVYEKHSSRLHETVTLETAHVLCSTQLCAVIEAPAYKCLKSQ